MRDVSFLFLAVALGAATVLAPGPSYALAAQHHAINKLPAAEVLKVSARQQVMDAYRASATELPPVVTFARDGRDA